ncbi:GatB/YqeY domain-containing protein [Bacteroidetes bacterium endosymbiont of Geopemphigus sp.]|uniref:GatB/YqeY domain-containing protein n=1 Tax=Bacteroidetes bacterium endosymbiont of Geopemphigus sp. TaxID=2047937 RepID=UPI000CCFFB5B
MFLAKTDEKRSSKKLSEDQETALLQKFLKQIRESTEQFSALNRLEICKIKQYRKRLSESLPETLSPSRF